jgi:hypothetical protein
MASPRIPYRLRISYRAMAYGNPKVYYKVSKEMGMTNEPAVLWPLFRTSKTTDSHDYTFRLVREGGCRVSEGAPIAACSVNKHSNNSNKTGRLKSPVSWDHKLASS